MLKNIIILCDSAAVRGGIENVAFVEAKELARRQYNVMLFAAMGPVDKTLEEAGVRVVCLGQCDILSNPDRVAATRQGIFNTVAYCRLLDILKDFGPADTVVHIHGWTKALSAAVFRATARYGFKMAITIHDYFSVCPNGGFYNYPSAEICTRKPLSPGCICCNCDSRSYPTKLFRVVRSFVQRRNMFKNRNIYMIYISRITRDAVLPHLGTHVRQSFYLRNPAQIQSGQPVDVAGNDIYLFIARLSPEKGVKMFCRAMTDLGLKGCVLGDGYLREELERAYPNVTFAGWVGGDEKDRLIRLGKCLVFPSLWYEGSPLTILEMMSYGIPCIVPDRCAASEEVDDGRTGFVFKSGDQKSLEEAIKKYEKADIGAMQRNILSTFDAEGCSPEAHMTNLLKIYESILED